MTQINQEKEKSLYPDPRHARVSYDILGLKGSKIDGCSLSDSATQIWLDSKASEISDF